MRHPKTVKCYVNHEGIDSGNETLLLHRFSPISAIIALNHRVVRYSS